MPDMMLREIQKSGDRKGVAALRRLAAASTSL
jgi:hypothetical protein